MPRTLTDKGNEFMDSIPVRFREDPDTQAVLTVYAREFERLATTRDVLAAGLVTPAKADERLLPLWETVLGLPVAPIGVDLATRQTTAAAYLVALRQSGTGAWWEEAVTRIAGAGWSYDEHVSLALRQHNMLADPRATVTGEWICTPQNGAGGFIGTPVADVNLGGKGMEVVSADAAPGFVAVQTSNELPIPDGGPVKLDTWYGLRMRLVLQTTLAGDAPTMGVVLRNSGGAQSTSGGVTLDVAPPALRSLPAGSVVDLTGRFFCDSAFFSGAARDHVGLIMSANNVDGGGTFRFGQLMIVELRSATAPIPHYFDGVNGGDWLGTADASESRRASPAEGHVQVNLPFDVTSASWTIAKSLIERITDAHITLDFVSTSPFTLDVSQLDVDRVP